MDLAEAMTTFKLSSGEGLQEASEKQALAVVFLRHFGCTFTRELLSGLETMQQKAESEDARLVLVHMLQEGKESCYLPDPAVTRIADPACDLYRAFGLKKGGLLALFGPRVIYRGALAFFQGHGVGRLAGDGFQMPGAFLVRDGKILKSQVCATAADLPELEVLF